MVWWKSHIRCDDWLVVLGSQSNLKRWMYLRTLDSLSIVLWIATCWWHIGRSGRNVSECWWCSRTVVGGVPTMQVGEWLVCVGSCGGWSSCTRCRTSRRRGDAERRVIEFALLGRLEACLDVESLLLEEDRGREERRVRRVDL